MDETTEPIDVTDTTPTVEPLRVGVVGAGPWATMVHAPMFANHPATTLAGVWARRPGAAEKLALRHGAAAFASVEELFDACDAVTFAVPPDVQTELAVLAAQAGKAVLLEKPIALDVDGAARLADAIDAAGVGSQVVFSWRYTEEVRSFLADVGSADPIGGRGQFISGAALGGPFATPWRGEQGPLFDLGPHVIDTLDAALGAVVGVRAHGQQDGWIGLLLEHDSGVVSEVSMTARCALQPGRAGAEVYTEAGVIEVDAGSATGPATFVTVVDEFVATARGTAHPLDVHRGLHIQRVIADALADLRSAR